MTIPKRNKRHKRVESVKALPLAPANKAILEPVEIKYSRVCGRCYFKSNSVYCPRCGKVTNKILE
jgi:hypothetical protein